MGEEPPMGTFMTNFGVRPASLPNKFKLEIFALGLDKHDCCHSFFYLQALASQGELALVIHYNTFAIKASHAESEHANEGGFLE